MKKLLISLTVLSILTHCPVAIAEYPVALPVFSIVDGESHTIDDSTYQDFSVCLDTTHFSFPLFEAIPGTNINLINNGLVGAISAYQQSYVTMTGGTIEHWLSANDNAVITMSGGIVNDYLHVMKDGTIYLDGMGFEVNGHALASGDKLSPFGILATDFFGADYYTNIITGTLSDGTALDNEFRIYKTAGYAGTADIIIVPEPFTLFFLGLGGLVLRCRRK